MGMVPAQKVLEAREAPGSCWSEPRFSQRPQAGRLCATPPALCPPAAGFRSPRAWMRPISALSFSLGERQRLV